MNDLDYQKHGIKILGEYDTVIIGGGTAGVSAGISSAKLGSNTLIIEKNGNLGGSQTNSLVAPMMPSYIKHWQNFYEIEDKLQSYGDMTRDDILGEYVWFSPEKMALAEEELFLNYGGHILYQSTFIDCQVNKGVIEAVILMTVEGIIAIKGNTFIDASGDAILARCAGAPVSHGDEEGHNQMSSLRFEMAGIDVEEYRQYCLTIQDDFSPLKKGYFFESAMVAGKNFKLEPIFQRGVADGILKESDLRYYQCFSIPGKKDSMTFNCPHISTLTDNTKVLNRSNAMSEGRQQIKRFVQFLIAYMPGFEHAYLSQEANMLGVRESYRLIGNYVLSEKDYLKRARFEDAIAKGDWYIDVHSASKGLVHMDKFQKGEYYEIPYRSMICKELSNMLVIGRCISTTFLMQASVRIQPTIIDMGESAGKIAAYAAKNQVYAALLHPKKISEIIY